MTFYPPDFRRKTFYPTDLRRGDILPHRLEKEWHFTPQTSVLHLCCIVVSFLIFPISQIKNVSPLNLPPSLLFRDILEGCYLIRKAITPYSLLAYPRSQSTLVMVRITENQVIAILPEEPISYPSATLEAEYMEYICANDTYWILNKNKFHKSCIPTTMRGMKGEVRVGGRTTRTSYSNQYLSVRVV